MINIENHVSASRKQIINIVRRSLSYIDARLVEHGARVAYIACKLASLDGLKTDLDTLLTLCLFHDIGAYKTEEISNLVTFETADVKQHAAYGYVFLKSITSLGEYAKAILYHHTSFKALSSLSPEIAYISQLIFLADRVDILLLSGGKSALTELRRLSGTLFSPELVDLFYRAEEVFDLSGHILDMSYKEDIETDIDALRFSDSEISNYLNLIVYSIDFRSPFTVTHTANTTSVSSFLAKSFNMSETDRRNITMGAFLHDIGKIAIPSSILESPGKLSEDEMKIIRTHVDVSEKILRGIVTDEVCEISIRHHEKLNGSGYSRGLRAPQLTRAQRIVAVADIVSALINRRSYKEPFSKEKTVSILSSMRDRGELCPEICNMAIDNFDKMLSFTDKSDNPVTRLYERIRDEYHALA